MNKRYLTKSRFLEGIQCPERLLKSLNLREPLPIDLAQEQIFANGQAIGLLARELFSKHNGIDCEDGLNQEEQIHFSGLKIQEGPCVLFEPTSISGQLFSKSDVLRVKPSKTLSLNEVKSTTTYKPEIHNPDLYFQKIVLEDFTGMIVDEMNLIHINNQYQIDPNKGFELEKFFTIVNVPYDSEYEEEIRSKIQIQLNYINQGFPQNNQPHQKCTKPYPCPFFSECTGHLGTILNLRRGMKKMWEYANSGIVNIAEIPNPENLTEFQRKQYEAEVSSEPNINWKEVNEFINNIEFPVTCLDFEGFNTPEIHKLPIYNVKPYSQIVFQAVANTYGSFDVNDVVSHIIIATKESDPRLQVATFLSKTIPKEGSVLVYGASYEKTQLKQLSKLYPQFNYFFESIADRIIDVERIFSSGSFVHKDFKGKTSVKSTLGVVCPELSEAYKNLPLINNGLAASFHYLKYFKGELSNSETTDVFKSLTDYCSLDVEALMLIIINLRRMYEESHRRRK